MVESTSVMMITYVCPDSTEDVKATRVEKLIFRKRGVDIRDLSTVLGLSAGILFKFSLNNWLTLA